MKLRLQKSVIKPLYDFVLDFAVRDPKALPSTTPSVIRQLPVRQLPSCKSAQFVADVINSAAVSSQSQKQSTFAAVAVNNFR